MLSIATKSLSCYLAALIYIFSLTCSAASITIVNNDSSGEGFNDPTSVTPVTGNPGVTLGEQRLNVFNAAAQFWSDYLQNQIPIRVRASMDPLACGEFWAVLGSAGPRTFARDFPNAPLSGTFYPIALAQELAQIPGVSNSYEINAQFNSEIGSTGCLPSVGWSYVIGEVPAPGTGNSLYTTVLHEIAHGLGFLTLVSQSGVRATSGGIQYDDPFMVHLVDDSDNTRWTDMTNAQRASSSVSNDLAWDGAKVKAALSTFTVGQSNNGRAKMYSPNPYQGGSSVSHFDTSFVPNEMMEPSDTGDIPESKLTKALLCDIGWPCPTVESPGSGVIPAIIYMLDQ